MVRLSLLVSKLPCGKKMQRDSGCSDCSSFRIKEECSHWLDMKFATDGVMCHCPDCKGQKSHKTTYGGSYIISDLAGLKEKPIETILELLYIELNYYDKEVIKNKQLFGVESKKVAYYVGFTGYIQYLIQLIEGWR